MQPYSAKLPENFQAVDDLISLSKGFFYNQAFKQ